MSTDAASRSGGRRSVAWIMLVVLLIAADLAALRSFFPLEISIFWTSYPWSVIREDLPPRFPNLGAILMILILEVGVFRMVSGRGPRRAFWIGFEAVGWSLVLVALIFARDIWWQARETFETDVIGREIGRPHDMGQLVLFVSGLHLLTGLGLALVAGLLTRATWRRWEVSRRRSEPIDAFRLSQGAIPPS
jgi:hypothetical protein